VLSARRERHAAARMAEINHCIAQRSAAHAAGIDASRRRPRDVYTASIAISSSSSST